MDSLQSILGVSFSDFVVNGLFAFVDVFFAFFLWIIDRRNKKRQEESLDIILDQVAKVNQFQTRTLALAIESLGIEVENIKTMLNRESAAPTNTENVYPTRPAPVTEKQPVGEESFTNQLGKILSNQVGSLIQNIQTNISEAKTATQKDSYRRKKGLEFDLKTLLKNIDGLKDFVDMSTSQEPDKQLPKDFISIEAHKPDEIPTEDIIKTSSNKSITAPVTKGELTPQPQNPTSDKKIINDLEEQADNIKSLNDIDNLANTIAKIFSKEFKVTRVNANQTSETNGTTHNVRKKVVPTRSKPITENDENR